MRFKIRHTTRYAYAGTASESFMEARLTPVTDERQRLLARRLTLDPPAPVHAYDDYFGNRVESFSIVHRHTALALVAEDEVETVPWSAPAAALDVSVSEARQIYRSEKLALFEFLVPSPAIRLSPETFALANQFFRPGDALGPALLRLNSWVKQHLRYVPGATVIDTPVHEVLRRREGVCQDFAQLMLAILRSADIPARYVAGYIETEEQRRAATAPGRALPKLIGAAESHAWVEVCLPGGCWWPLDPTNDCLAGERHVKVATGRDYLDSTPTRGVFKGTRTERLSVAVVMRRV